MIDIGLSYLKRSSKRVDAWLDGRPILLASDGRLDVEAVRNTRISKDEILEAARQLHGLVRLDQIKYAVLEADGDISVIPLERASSTNASGLHRGRRSGAARKACFHAGEKSLA